MPTAGLRKPFHARADQQWFYHDLAGIQGDPEGPGFKKIVIKPRRGGD